MQEGFFPNRQALTGGSRDCMIQLDNEGDEPASSARRCFIGEETNQTLALDDDLSIYIWTLKNGDVIERVIRYVLRLLLDHTISQSR